METTLKTLLSIISAFFFPLYSTIILIFGLVFMDTILACLADYKSGGKYEDHKLNIAFNKLSIYLMATILVHAFGLYFGFDAANIVRTLIGFIILKELTSSDKHINSILGFSLFKYIISKLNEYNNTTKKK